MSVVVIASVFVLNSCGESSENSSTTVEGGSSAYSVESVDELVKESQLLGVASIVKIGRDPTVDEIHNDELLQQRVVTAVIEEPLKDSTAGQTVEFVDGMYSRTRPSPDVEYGAEELLLLTPDVMLEVGDTAIVGLRNDELMAQYVFLIEDDKIVDTGRTGPLFEQVEGKDVGTVVTDFQRLAAGD